MILNQSCPMKTANIPLHTKVHSVEKVYRYLIKRKMQTLTQTLICILLISTSPGPVVVEWQTLVAVGPIGEMLTLTYELVFQGLVTHQLT